MTHPHWSSYEHIEGDLYASDDCYGHDGLVDWADSEQENLPLTVNVIRRLSHPSMGAQREKLAEDLTVRVAEGFAESLEGDFGTLDWDSSEEIQKNKLIQSALMVAARRAVDIHAQYACEGVVTLALDVEFWIEMGVLTYVDWRDS